MGVGFARWEGAEVSWTLLYDEVIFVIEGRFELSANGVVYSVEPGQVLWIPDGTEVVYAGHALFGYLVYPGEATPFRVVWEVRLYSILSQKYDTLCLSGPLVTAHVF
jgi:hypothetical protein